MSLEMNIRNIQAKDSKEVLDLLNSDENLTEDSNFSYDESCVREYIEGDSFITFVCENNEEIIGLIIAQVSKIAKYFQLNMLVVKKDHKRKGVASELVSFLENRMIKEGYNLSFLYTEEDNEPMKELSEKENYRKGRKFIFYSKELK